MFSQNLDYIILAYFAFFFIAGIQDRKLKWPFAAQPTRQKDGTSRGLSPHVSKVILKAAISVSSELMVKAGKEGNHLSIKSIHNKEVK